MLHQQNRTFFENHPTVMAKHHADFNVSWIKQLFADLKKRRLVMTWQEFAEKVGYDRTYISRVINGHESLTEELVKKIRETDFESTENVTNVTNEDTPAVVDPINPHPSSLSKDETIAILVRQQANLSALLNRLVTLERIAKQNSDILNGLLQTGEKVLDERPASAKKKTSSTAKK